MIITIVILLLALSSILFIFTKPIKPNKYTETSKYLCIIKDNGYKIRYEDPRAYDYFHCAVWIHDSVTNTILGTIPVRKYITLNTENEIIDIDDVTLNQIKDIIDKDNIKRNKIINRHKKEI